MEQILGKGGPHKMWIATMMKVEVEAGEKDRRGDHERDVHDLVPLWGERTYSLGSDHLRRELMRWLEDSTLSAGARWIFDARCTASACLHLIQLPTRAYYTYRMPH